MQLVAYGAQDIYLTGNPQITFFKVVYRRHTNFSMEAIEQTWNGTPDGGVGSRCTATISRNGDLVHRMYIEIEGNPEEGVENHGASWIDSVELEIGGQKIDKHTGLWMEVWAELTEPNPTGSVGCIPNTTTPFAGGTLFQKMSLMGGVGHQGGGDNSVQGKTFVPLQFWFCRNPGLALPLIALQYHEVKVILQHKLTQSFESGKQTLFCDYIYLDTDERRRFAQVSHEYLIEQVQVGSLAAGTGDLNFNHPVKELIWCDSNKITSAGADSSATMAGDFILKLNGHDRFAARDFRYFTRTQIWQHHSGAGGLNSDVVHGGAVGASGGFNDSIAVYSFALKPEEHQPSGTCNFSRIDNARLECTDSSGSAAVTTIFAVNYNVLRIMSGMGGLAYSN